MQMTLLRTTSFALTVRRNKFWYTAEPELVDKQLSLPILSKEIGVLYKQHYLLTNLLLYKS
jgi:hypothetical protein